jgi:hypothetical protein
MPMFLIGGIDHEEGLNQLAVTAAASAPVRRAWSMVTYAYDQIDHARTELNAVSE